MKYYSNFILITNLRSNNFLIENSIKREQWGSKPAGINILFEESLELAHLWLDDCSAIALIGVEIVVVLMILLSNVELLQSFDLSHYLGWISWIFSLLRHLLQHLPNSLVVLLFLVKNYGSVLGTWVIALPVQSGWVMDVHEDIEKGWVMWLLLEYAIILGSK